MREPPLADQLKAIFKMAAVDLDLRDFEVREIIGMTADEEIAESTDEAVISRQRGQIDRGIPLLRLCVNLTAKFAGENNPSGLARRWLEQTRVNGKSALEVLKSGDEELVEAVFLASFDDMPRLLN